MLRAAAESSSGEQLLFVLKPRQEDREVSAKQGVSSIALQGGEGGSAWQPSSGLAGWRRGAVVPDLALQAADRNLGLFFMT